VFKRIKKGERVKACGYPGEVSLKEKGEVINPGKRDGSIMELTSSY